MWKAHDRDVVGRAVKACMTGCSHQAYPEDAIKTVRKRLFCVSVYALQLGLQAFGADKRIRVGESMGAASLLIAVGYTCVLVGHIILIYLHK